MTALGDFVEGEYKRDATKEDAAKIIEEMIEFLKSAGCTNLCRSQSGYPYVMLNPDNQDFEDI